MPELRARTVLKLHDQKTEGCRQVQEVGQFAKQAENQSELSAHRQPRTTLTNHSPTDSLHFLNIIGQPILLVKRSPHIQKTCQHPPDPNPKHTQCMSGLMAYTTNAEELLLITDLTFLLRNQ